MSQTFKQLWELLTPTERRKFFLVLGMVMLMAALETLGVVSIMPFLAVLGNPEIVTEQPVLRWMFERFGFADTGPFIVALGIASAMIVGASSLFKSVTLHALNRFANLQRHSISSRLLENYLRQPYTFFLNRNTADLSKSLLSETDLLIANILQPAVLMLAHAVVVIAVVLLLLFYDPLMAITVAVVVGGLYGLIYWSVRGILGRIGPEREKANSKRFLASAEAFGAIKEVKVTGATDAYLQRFHGPSRQVSRHMATNETLSQVPLYLVEALGYAGLITVTIVLVLRGDNLGQVLPVLGLYAFAALRLLPASQIIYRCAARMRFGSSALQNIHCDLMLRPRKLDSAALQSDSQPLHFGRAISLRGVSFSYPDQTNAPALVDVTVDIFANTSVGIVGTTGSGKSTLVDLLLGLIVPQHGAVMVDDTELTPETIPHWQKMIGYVPQQIYIADSSVAENIAFGVDADKIDHEAVERAARAAQIHDFVSVELPHGYRTQVGERGVRLSGGQRQRIGIARALYRDPAVLVLDEATSALDNQTEDRVMTAVRAMGGRKTIILIAHRLTTVRSCDKILLLDAGTLASEGSFDDLRESSAHFRTLAAATH